MKVVKPRHKLDTSTSELAEEHLLKCTSYLRGLRLCTVQYPGPSQEPNQPTRVSSQNPRLCPPRAPHTTWFVWKPKNAKRHRSPCCFPSREVPNLQGPFCACLWKNAGVATARTETYGAGLLKFYLFVRPTKKVKDGGLARKKQLACGPRHKTESCQCVAEHAASLIAAGANQLRTTAASPHQAVTTSALTGLLAGAARFM